VGPRAGGSDLAAMSEQCSQAARGQAGPRGGTFKSPDEIGLLDVVRPGRPKCRTAALRQDGGSYRVRHVLRVGGRRPGTVGDGRAQWGTVEDGQGLLEMWAAEAMIYGEDFTQWSETS